jgi:hypothetical protein
MQLIGGDSGSGGAPEGKPAAAPLLQEHVKSFLADCNVLKVLKRILSLHLSKLLRFCNSKID